MRRIIIYIHGKGGNAEEANHYRPLFPGSDVVGLDYTSQNPLLQRMNCREKRKSRQRLGKNKAQTLP